MDKPSELRLTLENGHRFSATTTRARDISHLLYVTFKERASNRSLYLTLEDSATLHGVAIAVNYYTGDAALLDLANHFLGSISEGTLTY
jgi:hypothetical protein